MTQLTTDERLAALKAELMTMVPCRYIFCMCGKRALVPGGKCQKCIDWAASKAR